MVMAALTKTSTLTKTTTGGGVWANDRGAAEKLFCGSPENFH